MKTKHAIFLMSLIIAAAVILQLITGCTNYKYKNRIVCDSGFKTPWSYIALIDDGNVFWRVERYGNNYYERKMIQGEICHKEHKSK